MAARFVAAIDHGTSSTRCILSYSEQIGPSGGLLGNLLEAFTHLALIRAALNLDRPLAHGRR